MNTSLSLLQKRFYAITYLFNNKLAFYGTTTTKKENEAKEKNQQKKVQKYKKLLKKGLKGEILYGVHPITAALSVRKREFYRLHIKESVLNSQNEKIKSLLDEVKRLGVEVVVQEEYVLNHLSAGRPHQSLCMDVSALKPTTYNKQNLFEDNLDKRWLILDCIQDPMNLGSILRSSFYFGFNKVFINCQNSCGLTATVSKASAGAMELSCVYAAPDMHALVKDLKEHAWMVLGLTVADSASMIALQDAPLYRGSKVAVVLGNEGSGLEKGLEQSCTSHIHIKPSLFSSSSSSSSQLSLVKFDLDSLNVNVVAGIVLNSFSLPCSK